MHDSKPKGGRSGLLFPVGECGDKEAFLNAGEAASGDDGAHQAERK